MAKQSQVTTLDDNQDAAEAASAPAAAVVKGANHDDALSGARRTVTIHPTDGEGGSDAVAVSINGYAYQIPRGTPQSVPVEVLEVLKNAKTTIFSAAAGGGTTERTVQRFAFSAE